MTLKNSSGESVWSGEILASVVVFLVALPLCMGIAIASGVSPANGLISGMIGGVVVGLLAGSPLQVSGPAAGLAVLVYQLVQQHGVVVLGPVVLLAGVVQLAAGFAKIGRLFQAVPRSVIAGMLAGIGVLIFVGQFHVMVDDKPKGSPLQNIITLPGAIYKGITPNDNLPHEEAAFIGVFTIVVMLLWNGPLSKKIKHLRMIPGALVAVTLATIITTVFQFPITKVSLPDSLFSTLTPPSIASLELLLDSHIVGAAVALALVASAETLLSAAAVDRMHSGPKTDYNRELIAQGVGNMLSGAVGGLPITGVIVRSSANVEAGAKTRYSAVLHGLWLLAFVVAAPFVLRQIPIPALAALLVFTGYKLMKQDVKALLKGGRSEVAIFFVTVISIVVFDLLKGVGIGLGLAVFKLLWVFSHLEIKFRDNSEAEETSIWLSGSATFLRLPELTETLNRVAPARRVNLYFTNLNYIDHACFEEIAEWEKQHISKGGQVSINWDNLQFFGQAPQRRRGKQVLILDEPPAPHSGPIELPHHASAPIQTQQVTTG